jgi:succinate-semialdehyde dehydrogenase
MQEIHHQVQKSLNDGARLITGGIILDHDRNLYAPTVIADITPGMTAWEEEIFGPVASVCKAKTAAEAILLANKNDF